MPILTSTALKIFDNVQDLVSDPGEVPSYSLSRAALADAISSIRKDGVAAKLSVKITVGEKIAEITYNISGKNEKGGDIEPEITLRGKAVTEFYRRRHVPINDQTNLTLTVKRETAIKYFGGRE